MLVLILAACGSGESESVTVTVCGDLEVPSDLDMLRVSVVASDGAELWSGLSDLTAMEGPLTYESRVPELGTDEWVRVQGLFEGVVRLGVDGRVEGGMVSVSLDGSCLGVRCPLGQTCMDGECGLIGGEPQCP